MPSYDQFTTYELEQKRADLYAQIESLRDEYMAIGREIQSRILAGDFALE